MKIIMIKIIVLITCPACSPTLGVINEFLSVPLRMANTTQISQTPKAHKNIFTPIFQFPQNFIHLLGQIKSRRGVDIKNIEMPQVSGEIRMPALVVKRAPYPHFLTFFQKLIHMLSKKTSSKNLM